MPGSKGGLYQESGKWYLRIAVHGQMQRFGKPNGFPTKEAARVFRDRLRAAIREGRYFPNSQRNTGTLEDLRVTYLAGIKGKKASYRDKARHLTFWAQRFPKKPIYLLHPSDVSRGLTDLHQQCSQATANRYAETLRAMMRKEVKPFTWVLEFWKGVELYSERERVMPIMTEREMDTLFDAATAYDARLIYLNLLIGH